MTTDKKPDPRSTVLPPDDNPPVFDLGEDDPSPLRPDDTLNVDDENNVLPGDDPSDDDPFDNGDEEQNDPEDILRKSGLGGPRPPG